MAHPPVVGYNDIFHTFSQDRFNVARDGHANTIRFLVNQQYWYNSATNWAYSDARARAAAAQLKVLPICIPDGTGGPSSYPSTQAADYSGMAQFVSDVALFFNQQGSTCEAVQLDNEVNNRARAGGAVPAANYRAAFVETGSVLLGNNQNSYYGPQVMLLNAGVYMIAQLDANNNPRDADYRNWIPNTFISNLCITYELAIHPYPVQYWSYPSVGDSVTRVLNRWNEARDLWDQSSGLGGNIWVTETGFSSNWGGGGATGLAAQDSFLAQINDALSPNIRARSKALFVYRLYSDTAFEPGPSPGDNGSSNFEMAVRDQNGNPKTAYNTLAGRWQ